jgi:hypothetical protein
MEHANQKPNSSLFVVHAESDTLPKLRRLLGDMATIEELEGTDTALVRIKDGEEDPKSVWMKLTERVRNECWLAPILIDTLSQEHFPTGDVSVRFDHVPTDQELNVFAQSHNLTLEGKNKYITQQAKFRPIQDRAAYLPDLIDSLASENGVARAWANTLSRYSRR